MTDTSASPTLKSPAAGWLHWNFACITLLSAFLLFQVQPLVSKCILPWFGGAPAVWTTCLLFFQTMLFVGYLYAHLLQRYLPLRAQIVVHLLLVLVAMVLLPIAPGTSWKPTDGSLPVGRITLLLAATVGLPYFALSATSPLVQAWFSRSCPDRSPYRLYALSNIGSLAALLSFPFFFEPKLDLTQQSSLWSASFAAYAVLCAICMIFLRKLVPAPMNLRGVVPGSAAELPGRTDCTDGHADDVIPAAPTMLRRGLWLLLPACASLMLMATTNHVCQDIAVVPFLWVVPLALYLLSFIVCFDHPRWYQRGVWATVAALLVVAATLIGTLQESSHAVSPVLTEFARSFPSFAPAVTTYLTHLFSDFIPQLVAYFATLFLICMVCHGELARLKPDPRHLTEFYLMIAAGGALGGGFVSLLAPRVFTTFFEWEIGLVLSYCVAVAALWVGCRRLRTRAVAYLLIPLTVLLTSAMLYLVLLSGSSSGEGAVARLAATMLSILFHGRVGFILSCVVAIAALLFVYRRWPARRTSYLLIPLAAGGLCAIVYQEPIASDIVCRMRNFYGVVSVTDRTVSDPDTQEDETVRSLVHGWIVHGSQFLAPEKQTLHITYYGEQSGVGRAIEYFHKLGKMRLGAVGLGTGTLSCYAEPGDEYRFYEINPQILDIAQTYFTYLKHCREKIGDGLQIVMGDARLSLERQLQEQKPQGFHVLALDAFSSDAIPSHLLTREAVGVYLQHLAPGGVLAVHISNRYLDLAPVVRGLAEYYGLKQIPVSSEADESRQIDAADWILLTTNKDFEREMQAVADLWPDGEADECQPIYWTDQYSNLFQILRRQ